MPCFDPRDDAAELAEAAKRLDTYADMLCRLCRYVERLGPPDRAAGMPDDIKEWWEVHKAWDALREEQNRKSKKHT